VRAEPATVTQSQVICLAERATAVRN
jgi:hypothetical protein